MCTNFCVASAVTKPKEAKCQKGTSADILCLCYIHYSRHHRGFIDHDFFTTQHYASAVYAVALCLSVCLCMSVRLSQVDVLLKWLNVGSRKQHCTIACGL